jgi:uncharacterized protein (DUF305 family)
MSNDHTRRHAAREAHAHAGDHLGTASPSPHTSSEYAEASEALRAVNERMHRGMAAEPSGDPDRDFAVGMLAHHEGAVDMARWELRYGRDPDLRRLAEAIIAAQGQEIAMMRDWLAARR